MTLALRLLLAAPLLVMAAACAPDPAATDADDVDARAAPAGELSPKDAANPAAPTSPAAPGEVAGGIPPLTPQGFAGYIVGNRIPMAGPDKPVEQPRASEACRMYKDRGLPDVWIMTDGDDIVRRITLLGTSQLRTAAGIGVGSREAEVRAAYPVIRAEPNEYAPAPAKNLYTAPAGQPGLRFDIDAAGKVVEVHGGAAPWLGYSEGCA